MEALPDELIDMTSIAGPKDRARERLRAFRDAGVETLIISPMAFDAEERQRQLRLVAEVNNELN
jgi:alkanesulfonate monooxygenase SsuD/methylene tetrahydromethanopterin reductase-like flavin-dependent oxidoreductase (luciferase family)